MSVQLRRRLGAVTWAVGLLIATLWGGLRSLAVEAPGIGWAPPVTIAPLEGGRLKELPVALHAEVTADDVVAVIDPVLVEAERALASATLLATRDRVAIEQAAAQRAFAETAEGTTLTRAQLVASIREDEALLATLRERVAIEQDLADRGAISGLTTDEARWQAEVVEARLRASRAALAAADRAAANAEERSRAAPGASQWDAVAALRALELVERRLELYSLRAGIDGHVTAIFAAPGATVPAGMPVVEVRRRTTREVVAYVGASDATRLAPGAAARVVRPSGEVLDGRLVSVGGSPQALPLSLWPWPNEPRFAVPVRIALVTGEVVPDEPVTVRL